MLFDECLEDRTILYDIGLEEMQLLLEDFNVVEVPMLEEDITLVERGIQLVPLNQPNVKELQYGDFTKLAGAHRLTKTDIDLKMMYNKFNRKIFNNKLPKDVCVYWTKRMTSCAGICSYKRNRFTGEYVEFSIGLSTPYHEKFPNEIEDTLVHEMIHILYPNQSHGYAFKSEMGRINREFGMSISIHAKERAVEKKYNYLYACDCCGYEYKRLRRHKNDYKGATCGVKGCRGGIYLKEDLVNGFSYM